MYRSEFNGKYLPSASRHRHNATANPCGRQKSMSRAEGRSGGRATKRRPPGKRQRGEGDFQGARTVSQIYDPVLSTRVMNRYVQIRGAGGGWFRLENNSRRIGTGISKDVTELRG